MKITCTIPAIVLFAISMNAEAAFIDDFESGTLANWTVGGRQLAGTNIADVESHNGSLMGHVYKNSFTETVFSRTFSYDPTMSFSFDMQASSFGGFGATSNYYGLAGSAIQFLDSSANSLGYVYYASATSNYLDTLLDSDPTTNYNAVTPGVMQHLSFSIADVLAQVTLPQNQVSSVVLSFRGYSSYYGSAGGEVWVDNVSSPADASLSLPVPLPGTPPLIAVGLVYLGFLGWRGKENR